MPDHNNPLPPQHDPPPPDDDAPRPRLLEGITEGLGYRALGLFLAISVAILSAEFIADGTLAFLVAVIGGGLLGGYFFWLADKRTGRKPMQ